MIYALMFIASTALLWIAGALDGKKKLKIAIIIIAISLPCLLAAFRGLTVGSDTGGYVYDVYNGAKEAGDIGELVSFSNERYYSTDLLYLGVNYIVAKSGLPFQVLLLLFECLIVIPTYFAIKRYTKNDKKTSVGMALFYLSFYNLSLNMVRQSIALSFVLLGLSFLVNKRDARGLVLTIIFIVIGCGFHDTAVISLVFLPLFAVFNSERIKKRHKRIIFFSIVLLLAVVVALYRPILSAISQSGIYPKALLYLENYSRFDINYLGTVRNIFLICIVYILSFKKDECGWSYFPKLLAISNLLVGLLGTFIEFAADRIAYYPFSFILLLFIPKMVANDKNKKLLIVILCFFILHWLIVIVINNSNSTLPYVIY